MRVREAIGVQGVGCIEKHQAVIFATNQGVCDREGQGLLPTRGFRRGITQTRQRALANEEGFIAQTVGIKGRGVRQRRERLGLSKQPGGAALGDVETVHAVLTTGAHQHQ